MGLLQSLLESALLLKGLNIESLSGDITPSANL